MEIYKFGGASVKDAEGVRNIANIIRQMKLRKAVVIISAMGKMTNAFEKIVNSYFEKSETLKEEIDFVKIFHNKIIADLFHNQNHPVFSEIKLILGKIDLFLSRNKSKNYDFIYDQVVPFGEILSTKIVSVYLQEVKICNEWLNVKDYVITNSNYRDAKVNWEETQENIRNLKKDTLYIAQGFMGADKKQNTTSLGREGSDFTAAIFAYCLNAKNITIWKDVEGVLNADPRHFKNPVPLKQISYNEAVEMAFYGASVIHPKTLKPLQNKKIPLYVKSFKNPKLRGTVVGEGENLVPQIPCFIVKENQILVSIATKDFSFIVEDSIGDIFKEIHKYGMKVNVMQNSAISFSICLEDKYKKISYLLRLFKTKYNVKYNLDVTLYTIRHFSKKAMNSIGKNGKILLKQITGSTTQVVIK